MSRIEQIAEKAAAANRKLLIPYLVAGDPNLETTEALMHKLVEQGADIIELGIPFSDPSADGPIIQRGVERSLAKGTTLRQVLKLVARFRESDADTGIVLMGYLNPIEAMGYKIFAEAASASGVDGVLTVDLPPMEAGELNAAMRAAEVDTIFLVAPTTREERVASITEHCSGYLYYVSLKGVTGAALTDFASVTANINMLRERTQLPIVIGFGIKDAQSAAAMGKLADGVIIGSALVEKIALLADQVDHDKQLLSDTVKVISEAREALDKLV
ncbi:MAG: tryptophan synthase subunit alpha [Gammaproteobacteria bacterium]|nr:tryptophan synthase subunit alpha [Gammaproteobacteria bacterium]